MNLSLNSRPSFDDTALLTAYVWSQRSSDPKMKVGACILDHFNRVVGVGYNGKAHGEPEGCTSLETGKSGYLHAELNALLSCNWSDSNMHTLYVTHEPCIPCATAILNSRRVIRVVYVSPYQGIDSESGSTYLHRNGVITELLAIPPLR